MTGYFFCDICDISVKVKSKKKHLNSQLHKYLNKEVINRYRVEKSDFIQIENILKNYIRDYNKKFKFYVVICKWKLNFSNILVNVKKCSNSFHLRELVLSKIEYYERRQHKFSHISQMNITFISDLRDKTYKHYPQQPKSMLEWRLNIILPKNTELVKILGNSSQPLIRKYDPLFDDNDDDDDGEN